MPTYLYKCKDNNHEYEEHRSMRETQKQTTCAEINCNSELQKVWIAAPITFKGSGFYSNRG